MSAMEDRPIMLSDLIDYEEYCNTHTYQSKKGHLRTLQITTKGFIEWLKAWEPVRSKQQPPIRIEVNPSSHSYASAYRNVIK